MEIRDLGPLRVETDTIAVPLNGRRLASIVAILSAHADEVVTVDALIEAIWNTGPPARAAQSLESLIWRLRKILEPGRAARETATLLRTEDLGYRLALPREKVDSHRLIRASQVAGELLGAGNDAQALDVADAALSLWRGRPYLGVPDAQWMHPVRAQLEEAHLELQQHRVQALLGTAQPEGALGELVGLLADHPYRERFWGQRMLALYRSGRQSEALQAFADARAVLADELGIDPGPELRELHQQILDQAGALDLSAPSVTATGETHLPSRRRVLIGRAGELAGLVRALAQHRMLTLTGTGGCGKTRLAVEAAYVARASFPDGVWFIDLADVADPALVWSRVALALGLAPQVASNIAALTIAFLSSRRLLLLLDNCEQILDAVATVADRILESAPSVTLLATTREPLDLVGEQVYPLAPLHLPVGGEALAENAAVQLFTTLVGEAIPDLDLRGQHGQAIARICRAVGGLPLGLELAAARARNFELDEVAAALEPLHPDQAMDLVAGLVHRSLLTPGRTTHPGGPSMFAQLVPIRAHARSSLTRNGERAEVEAARNRWVIDHLVDAPNDGRDGQAEWYDWIDDNYAAIDGALTSTLVDAPSVTGLVLTDALTGYWYDRGRMIDGMRWLEAAMRLPDLDPFDRARALGTYGSARALNQETELALPALTQAMETLSSPTDEHAPLAGRLLAMISAAAWAGDLWAEAAVAATEARRIGEHIGDQHITLRARAVLTACEVIVGDGHRAVADAAAVLADNRAIGDHLAAFYVCITNAIVAVFASDPEAGLHWSGQAMRHQRALGVRNVSDTLEQRGHHYANAGNFGAALRCYGAASAQHEREGRSWPRLPMTPETLDHLRTAMSAADYERNWSSGQRLGSSAHQYLPEEWG